MIDKRRMSSNKLFRKKRKVKYKSHRGESSEKSKLARVEFNYLLISYIPINTLELHTHYHDYNENFRDLFQR